MLKSRQLGYYNQDRTALMFNTKTCQILYQIAYIEYVLLHNTLFQSHELIETLAPSAPEIPSHTIVFLPLSSLPIRLCFAHKAEFSGFPVPPHRPLPLKQHCLAAVRIYLKTEESNRKNDCSQPRLQVSKKWVLGLTYTRLTRKRWKEACRPLPLSL